MIKVVETPGKGRGLVATSDIASGDTITEAPVLYLDQLHHHVWEYNNRAAIALGPHQLVNHPTTGAANCETKCDGKTDKLIATRDIKVGEELTIDYVKEFGELGFTAAPKEGE